MNQLHPSVLVLQGILLDPSLLGSLSRLYFLQTPVFLVDLVCQLHHPCLRILDFPGLQELLGIREVLQDLELLFHRQIPVVPVGLEYQLNHLYLHLLVGQWDLEGLVLRLSLLLPRKSIKSTFI